MSKSIVLSKENSVKVIDINHEAPFCKITHITIPGFGEKLFANTVFKDITITLKKIKDLDSEWEEHTFFQGSSFYALQKKGEIIFENIFVDSNEYSKIELIYSNANVNDIEIKVHYDTTNRNVSLINPFENFRKHIEQKDNVKILFSAPFGQGKTTFLNYFFEQHSKEYEVFRVFPVNYSISHNEDVFKYIKAEILCQLLNKDVEFDKESFSYFLTAPHFFKNDPLRVLSPFIKLIPKIGKSAYEIIDPLYKLAKEYFDYHKKAKTNDKADAEKFISDLYEKEGAIFEDNFFTQLIRQQLEKLKFTSKKQNVLIIEDLDRMDPDHIFRILNVFAAHFDSLDYNDGYSNKFGFDKIIIVGDYYNIKHTFAYRYGPNVGFEGYINKYYSREPFLYDNKEAIAELVKDIKKQFSSNQYYIGIDLLICVLTDLIASEDLTLRDLVKLLKMDGLPVVYGQAQRSNKMSKAFYPQFLYFNLLCYLSKAFDIESLIQKFEKCKYKHAKIRWKYDYFASLGLPSLVVSENLERKNFEFNYKSLTLTFLVKLDWEPSININYYNVEDLKSLNSVGGAGGVYFNRSDFYEMLILNAKKYKEVGGFD